MKKINLTFNKDILIFDLYTEQIDKQNLNNTNVIDIENLKFTEDYIINNIDIVSTFLNLIVLKNKSTKVIIKNLQVAETVLILIKNIDSLKEIVFLEDKQLSYTICSLLIENINLECINCYNVPQVMFYKFKKNILETRYKIFSTSRFMKYNKITTYSKLFNKEKIIIEEPLSIIDIENIIDVFKLNKNIKKIEYRGYKKKNLNAIVKLLKQSEIKNATILIVERKDLTQNIINDIPLFKKIIKNNKIEIKIKYSNEYKKNNSFKELNIIMFKYILMFIIIFSIVFIILYKIIENNDDKNLKKSTSLINEVVNGAEENSKKDTVDNNSSNIEYSKKSYDELKKINSDTVGWLKVNNTKIDYPVVQTNNNEYYLNYSFNKTKTISGWIFVDYRNNMDNISKNTIIYGHSMLNNGSMFTTLTKALDKTWQSKNSNLTINFSIKGKEIKWKIFSVYMINDTSDYLFVDFNDNNEFIEFISKLKNRSVKNFNIEVNENDKILTLSTCYKNDKTRLVVHAKML